MNTKQFVTLFFCAAVLVCVDGFGTFGFAPVVTGLGVNLPILSAPAGTIGLPLALLGVLKLAAAASLAGISIASILGGGGAEEEVEYGYEPASSYSEPAVSYGAPADTYGAPAASYGAPAPSYSAPADSYGAPADSYGAPAPSYHGRRRRSAEESQALFTIIDSVDFYSCGKALVCELVAKDERALLEDERLLLSLFTKGNKSNKANSAKAKFDVAFSFGANKDQQLCRQRYASCPYTADEMMRALRNLN